MAAPRRTARAASTKPTKPDAATAPTAAKAKPATGAGRGRPTKEKTPAAEADKPKPTMNGTGKPFASRPAIVAESSKADKRARSKTPAAADAVTKASTKRRKSEEAEDEPEPKKAKTTAAVTPKDDKPKPKGPVRRLGKKAEINKPRHTTPLRVFVFGEGSNGELGLGASKKAIDVKRPRFNEALTNMNVVKIATGGMHCVALTADNKIVTWGVNDNGALGRDTAAGVKLKDMDEEKDDGSDSDSDADSDSGLNELEATPTAISDEYFPEDTTFVDVAAGDSCSFVLTTEGAVYGWGTFRKNEGVLGFARNVETARTPIYIEGLKKITQIVCGTNHVLALDADKHVWAWGSGQQNQLGRRITERNLAECLVPTRLGFVDHSIKKPAPSKKIEQIASGDYHSFAIADDGHVWSWGANNYAETGYPNNAGEDNAAVATAQVVHSLEGKNVKSIDGGSHHNIAVTTNGTCLVWGRCDGSQTGIPLSTFDSITDDKVVLKTEAGKPKILIQPWEIPTLKNIATATCGPEHSFAIDKDGKAYSWGFSANYQTGQGTDDDVEEPTIIANTAVKDVKLVYAGAGGQYSILASERMDLN